MQDDSVFSHLYRIAEFRLVKLCNWQRCLTFKSTYYQKHKVPCEHDWERSSEGKWVRGARQSRFCQVNCVLLCMINVQPDALPLCDGDGNTFSPFRGENNEVCPTMEKCEESYLRNCSTSPPDERWLRNGGWKLWARWQTKQKLRGSADEEGGEVSRTLHPPPHIQTVLECFHKPYLCVCMKPLQMILVYYKWSLTFFSFAVVNFRTTGKTVKSLATSLQVWRGSEYEQEDDH